MAVIDEPVEEITASLRRDEPMDEEELLAWCKSQVAKARNDRIPFERQWYHNMAFYFGRQWVEWKGLSAGFDYARMMEPPKAKHTVRLTVNKIRSRMLKTVAKLNQERPRGFVQPATADDADLAGARAAEKIYEYVTTEQVNLDQVMYWCDWWSVITGTAFLKSYFDDSVEDPAGGMGVIRVDELSPFHIFVPDLETQDMEKQPWVAHVCAKEVDDLRRIFGEVADDLEPTTASGNGSVLSDRFQEALGIPQNDAKTAVMYYEMYVKPNHRFPTGCKVCWAGDVLLDFLPGEGILKELPDVLPGDEFVEDPSLLEPPSIGGGGVSPPVGDVGSAENQPPAEQSLPNTPQYEVSPPFINGEYPIIKRTHLLSGKFYGSSPIEDMIPIQMEYNRGRSQIIESRNRMSKPQLLSPKGSVDVRKLTSAPGLVIEYTPGLNPPTPLTVQDLPSYVMEDLQLSMADLDEVSSMGDISRGDAPGRVEAATALGLLVEEVDAIIGLIARDKELATERLGRHILYYVHTYWDAPRSISVAGDNEAFEAYIFSSTNIRGNTHFKIEPGSGAPLSRAAKQAMIMELMKMGVVTPAQGLKYMKMGDSAKLYEEMQIDVRQAERENVKMSKKEDVGVNLYDNHIIHIQVHDDYAKRQEFENAEPLAQQLNRYHTFQHLRLLAQMAQIPLMVDPEVQNIQLQEEESGQLGPATAQVEMELRRIYDLIVKSGGMPPPQQPGMLPPGEQPA